MAETKGRAVNRKDITCPTCGAKPGESCGRQKLGVPWRWERAAPHAARKKNAAAIQWLDAELAKPEVDDGGAWDEIERKIAENPVEI